MAGEVVAEINRVWCLGFINRSEVRIMYKLTEKKIWVRALRLTLTVTLCSKVLPLFKLC